MAGLTPFPVFRALDAVGEVLSGGKLYSYQAGTTTPLATYTDQGGLTANANPVVLDVTGSANVWLAAAPYKLVLKDSAGATQWTVDNILPGLSVNFSATSVTSAVDFALTNPLGTALVINMTASGKNLSLPAANAATSIAKGVPIIIFNNGNPFTLKAVDGTTTIGTIQAGGAVLSLIDNSTANGTWALNAVIATSFSGCLVTRSTNQTIGNNSATAMSWDTEVYDTGAWHDGGAATRLTVPAGVSKVRVGGGLNWNSAGGGSTPRNLIIKKNGSGFAGQPSQVENMGATDGFVPMNVVSGPIDVTPGDYFELYALQVSGGSLDVVCTTTGVSCFYIEKIS